MARKENMMENNKKIDPKFSKKQIFCLYIPWDIYEVFISLHKS